MFKSKSWKIVAFFALSHVVATDISAQLGNSRIGGQFSMAKEDKYQIVDIQVVGAETLDPDLLKVVAGLQKGDEITLENDAAITTAMKKLWDQKLLEDVRIDATKVDGNRVWLKIFVVERPKLGNVTIKGVRSTQGTEIKDKLDLANNRMITEALKLDMRETIRKYFTEKGFNNVSVKMEETPNPSRKSFSDLTIHINKGQKIQVNNVNIVGNQNVSSAKLRRSMKGTKEMPRLSLKPTYTTSVYGDDEDRSFKTYVKNWGFLSPSKTLNILDPYFRYNFLAGAKYDKNKYTEDKEALINLYNNLGYRDAHIVSDTIYAPNGKNVNIDIKVEEGKRYYFGDIEFKGNSIYTDEELNKIVNIKKGDIYNRQKLESRLGLQMNPEGTLDVSGLYLDNGYLFFRTTAQEKSILNDTINFVVNITEGPIAITKNVDISGNIKTNDHVIRRELYTLPGNKFSRADVIRSIRQLSNLGYLDPEKITPDIKPNITDYTVDIDYQVAEKSSDQFEVSAGYQGGNIGFFGSIGLVFNNFSVRNIGKPKYWDPLPSGDGQKLSLKWQSSGLFFNSGNLTFTEPWLGGKKPNSLTVSAVWTRLSNSSGNIYSNDADPNNSYIKNVGGGVTFGKRLKWPDDYFNFSVGINYQNYFLKDYALSSLQDFTNGSANNLHLKFTLSRSSLNQMLYPTSGSSFMFSAQLTPPYSMFSEKDYADATTKEKYKWIEYHKYRFNAEWYQKIYGNLVLKVAAKYGLISSYNKDLGLSPFERFQLGGDGLSGMQFIVGKDIISHRGYEIYETDATIFNKYTVELRYPFSLAPTATIFGLIFADGAYAWQNAKQFNPLQLNRSVGAGLRLYLPMFGLMGLDYGIGIDRYSEGMSLGQYARFSFMLGFEPE